MLTRITGPDLYYWTDMKKFKHIDWRQLFSRHKTFWTVAAHGAGIVLLALLLTRFTIYNISSLSVFAPLDKEVDFKMSDLYNMVADSKAVHQFSPDILIVAIDGCSRRRTLEVINQVAACQPRAIGLDVYFPYPEEDNSYLLHTLSRTPNLVCSEYAVPEPDGIHYYRQQNLSFYDSLMQPAHSGFINLNVRDAQHVVRSFRPFVTSSANDTSFSMACEIARLVAPDKAQALLDRHEKEVTIDFTTYDFLVITADELNDCPAEWLNGRVVLIGDAQFLSDAHLTPLHGMKAGVMIHAFELQTILSGTYIDTTSAGLNWSIAVLLCVLYVSMLLLSKYKMANYGSLVLRVGQFALMYLLICIGCALYRSAHVYADFAPAILMIGLGSIAFDLWFGTYALACMLIEKLKKK